MATIFPRLQVMCALAVVSTALCGPALADPAIGGFREVPRLSAGELRRLEHGDILTRVERSSAAIKTVTSIGKVDDSAADVYRLTTDFRNYGRIYNSIKSVDIASQTPDVVVARFDLAAPWPLPGRDVTTRTRLDPGRFAFRWRRTAGSMRVYDGQMIARPLDADHCVVYYSAKVDPGYAFLPSWFVTWGQGYVLPSIIRAIRDTLHRHEGPYWAPGVVRPDFGESWQATGSY